MTEGILSRLLPFNPFGLIRQQAFERETGNCNEGISHTGFVEVEDMASIITLLTDFGLRDGYVASMKGVILGINPEATPVDISHLIPPQDVRSAAFVLFTTYEYFPDETVHLAVVDPGVGTGRRAIAVRTPSCFFVGPDNGIFSFILRKEKNSEARVLENPRFRREPVSMTFHGRDIFAPAAAYLTRGESFESLGPVCEPVTLPWSAPVVGSRRIEGEIIHIDHFGNAITNITLEELEEQAPAQNWAVRVGETVVSSIYDTYGTGRPGEVLALAGSSGFIEIAVNQGSAADALGLKAGFKVAIDLPGK